MIAKEFPPLELETIIKAFRQKHNLAEEADIDRQFQELDKKAESKQLEIQVLREKQQELLREKDKAEFQRATIDEKIQAMKCVEDAHKDRVPGASADAWPTSDGAAGGPARGQGAAMSR